MIKRTKVSNILYRSQYEANQAKILIKEKINFEYETKILEFAEPLRGGTCLDCGGSSVAKSRIYTPDFYFPDTNIFVELKGKFDSATRSKMRWVTEQCEEDVRMVFMRDNYLSRKHKMTYSRWCEINGITFSIGNIPLEWCRNV